MNPMSPMSLYNLLDQLDIAYESREHPPVYTCEQADALELNLEGADTKNLFLRDRKGLRHLLVSVPADYRVDLKALSVVLGTPPLSFASAERLQQHLSVEPGSVTLLAMVNDTEHHVEVVIDATLWASERLLCHPLVNTATVSIARSGLERLYAHTGHQAKVVEVPQHG